MILKKKKKKHCIRITNYGHGFEYFKSSMLGFRFTFTQYKHRYCYYVQTRIQGNRVKSEAHYTEIMKQLLCKFFQKHKRLKTDILISCEKNV